MENVWVCSCPDFEYRKIESCKHIYAVNLFIEQQQQKPQIFAEDSVKCDHCGSIKVMRYGSYNNKQIYKSKDCQHKFKEPSLLKKVKFDPEIIIFAPDLYFPDYC